jgi:hypothetical protein
MTYTPDYIRLSTNPDVLASGAQRINNNFDDISYEIDSAINGLAYQNPVISMGSAAPALPELGDRYIVSAFLDDQDPWFGHIDEIAEYADTDTWEFYTPSAGWCCTVLDEGQQYVYNEEQWNPLPVLVTHNDLANMDGGGEDEYYHINKDTYDALSGTGTPSTNNKFVTADSLTTDITTHTHDGEVTAQVDYGNLDNIPSTFTPASHTHSKTDVTDFAHTHAKTDVTDFAHASAHIQGIGDEIDGDKLDIDFNPSYYTPGTVTEADNVDHLSAHLHGIDLAIKENQDNLDGLEARTVGGFAIPYKFSVITDPTPFSGTLRFDSADLSLVTTIYAHEVDRNSVTSFSMLSNLENGDIIIVRKEATATAFAIYSYSSQTDNGTDRSLTVSYIFSNDSFTNLDDISLVISKRGFQGYQGYQGFQGFQGFQGTQGDQGYQGTQGFQGYQGFQGFQGVQGEIGSVEAHKSQHITLGSDEIDGDKLDIDWNPTNYMPATVINYADSVDNLTAHLNGIDSALIQGIIVSWTAAETLAQYNVTYSDSSSLGNLKKAVNTSEASADAIGIVLESGGISQNSSGAVALGPAIIEMGTWTKGATLYVSDTAGSLTQVKPVSGYIKPIGFAISTTALYFNPQIGWSVVSS